MLHELVFNTNFFKTIVCEFSTSNYYFPRELHILQTIPVKSADVVRSNNESFLRSNFIFVIYLKTS